MPFTCSICGEESTLICGRCTKDACDNHLCEKCLRCSDCCECEVRLSEASHVMVRSTIPEPAAMTPDPESPMPVPDPDPEPHLPGPDPDPEPGLPGLAPDLDPLPA